MNNKIMLSTCLVLFAICAIGAPQKTRNHVPAVLGKDIRPIYPEAACQANIALINAKDAIPASEWPLVSTYAASRINVNIWTNDSSKSVIRIFFLRGEPAEGVLVAPGKWARIDVSRIEEGNPDAQTLRDRRAKLILRAIAFACGGGSTVDASCSMFFAAQDIKGMDQTGIMLSPMCYFPMLEFLGRIGGNEITTVAMPDSE